MFQAVWRAFCFPFQVGQLLGRWLVPATLIVLNQFLTFWILFAFHEYTALPQEWLFLGVLPVTLLTNVILAGFFWHLTRQIKQSNRPEQLAELSMPWRDGYTLRYLIDGSQVFFYLFLLNLMLMPGLSFLVSALHSVLPAGVASEQGLMVLSVLLFVLLIPVLLAPIVHAADTFHLYALFQWAAIWDCLRRHYYEALCAAAIGLLFVVFYSVLSLLLLRIPAASILMGYLMMPMLLSFWVLLVQGLTGQLFHPVNNQQAIKNQSLL